MGEKDRCAGPISWSLCLELRFISFCYLNSSEPLEDIQAEEAVHLINLGFSCNMELALQSRSCVSCVG